MRLPPALRWTSMAAALTAAAAPPGVVVWARPRAAHPASSQTSPLDIRVGQATNLSHIEFRWAGGARYVARRDGQTLTLHFERLADPDMSLLSVDPPPFLDKAVLRKTKGATDIVLTLKPGADAKAGQADGAIFVNLFPAPTDAAASAQTAPPRPDPLPAGGVVRMKSEIANGQILLHFAWKNPLGAAAFRRGDALWLVFDTPAKLDLSNAPPQTPIFKSVRAVSGDGFSAIRVESPSTAVARAWADGGTWTLAIGAGPQPWPAPVNAERDNAAPLPTLRAQIAGATKAVWIDDPAVGDRIGVVTALAPSKGMASRRAFVDFNLLPSAQGLALEPIADDLTVSFDTDWVRISRPKGLALSTPQALAGGGPASIGLPQPAALPALIDFANWSRTGAGGFMTRYGDLQNRAADEIEREAGGDKSAGVKARMGLVRFLAGSELSYEAIGMLNLTAKAHPEMLSDPEFRGIRGAVRAMAGRYKEAENDFSVPALADDPASALWRGYIAAKQSDWAAAKDAFVRGMPAMNQFAPMWQARFAQAYADTALQTGQLDVANTEIALSFAQTKDPTEVLKTQLLQARLLEAEGMPKRALPLYDAVGNSSLDQVAAPAIMHATQIRLATGQITVAQAADTYDSLRYRWRGDATELQVIRTLGQLYLSQGRYREALEAMRAGGVENQDSPDAVALQNDMHNAFRALFLDGRADGMQPVQALALFSDFQQLTPIGADGDLMVRKMVQRLVDVDLLDQAASLLKYQVDNRLDGVAKAQVSTDLATIYLMNKQPEPAIEALNDSRVTTLPVALANQRRMVEARAWLALNQNDHALELIGKDASTDANDIRAEVAWREHQWPQVGALQEKALGDRWKQPGPLSDDEEAHLLRAGVAYSLALDDTSLARLRAHFGPMVDKARSADALKVALAGTAQMQGNPGDFTKIAGEDDAFSGWVSRMKARFHAPSPPLPARGKLASADSVMRG
ncbi:MAG TPA: endoglucanase [Caulobacteraceae bacterium]|nr:endoglucanase [Caulobacteraceae bacterium]